MMQPLRVHTACCGAGSCQAAKKGLAEKPSMCVNVDESRPSHPSRCAKMTFQQPPTERGKRAFIPDKAARSVNA